LKRPTAGRNSAFEKGKSGAILIGGRNFGTRGWTEGGTDTPDDIGADDIIAKETTG
jgi:hypothetical protein